MIRKTYTHAITSPTALSVHTSYPYHTCPCKAAGRGLLHCYKQGTQTTNGCQLPNISIHNYTEQIKY